MTRKFHPVILLVITKLLLTVTAAANADWTLDNEQSRLSFISVKAAHVGEVHTFSRLEGTLSDNGTLTVQVHLASLETSIPIRDERMRELLFETALFPTASIAAKVDPDSLSTLATRQLQTLSVEALLSIKDKTVPLTVEVMAAGISPQTLLVTSLQPVIINAASTGLENGLEKLREIAGLSEISRAVPVTFVLVFTRQTD